MKIESKNFDKLDDLSRELRDKISEYRKKGFDTYLAELLFTLFPSHLLMARATDTKEDFEKCVVLAMSIREELEACEFGEDT